MNTQMKSLILCTDLSAVTFLAKCGYDVITANNGKKALQLVNRALPDLVLLDVMMPEMNGFDVCARMQKNKETAQIPVIFMSDLGKKSDPAMAFLVGAADYIKKPIEKGELLKKVQLHLQSRKTEKKPDEEPVVKNGEPAAPSFSLNDNKSSNGSLAKKVLEKSLAARASHIYIESREANSVIHMNRRDCPQELWYVESKEANVIVRFQVDGEIRDVFTLKRAEGLSLISKFKDLENLVIAKKLEFKDGSSETIINSKSFKLGISSSLTPHGLRLNIRLLNRGNPMDPPEKKAPAPKTDARQVKDVAEFEKKPDKRESILVVDDDTDMQFLIKSILENRGYEVTLAQDGIDALVCLASKEFDMIVSDINMPNMNGVKMLEMIDRKGIGTPVLFLTGLAKEQAHEKGFELIDQDYIAKSIRKDVLLYRIERVIKNTYISRIANLVNLSENDLQILF